MTPGPITRRAVLVIAVLMAVLGMLVVAVLGRSDGSSTASAPDPSSTVAPAPAGSEPLTSAPPTSAPPAADPGVPVEPAAPDPTAPGPGAPMPVEPEVEAAIAADGSAPVLVRLAVPDALAPEERAGAVAAAADEVLAALPAGSAATAKPTGTTAVLALTVDADGLAALRSAMSVSAVSEDGINTVSSTNSPASIQAPQAWSAGADGTGQVIAVLDTGVARNHPYLTSGGVSDVLAEACFSSSFSNVNGAQWSSYCPDGSIVGVYGIGAAAPCAAPVGPCEHGTHVAGIAAGGTGAASLAAPPGGVSASGIAPDAELLGVQVFSRGLTTSVCGGAPPCAIAFDSDIIRGLDWVYGQRGSYPGLAAVNLSLGGGKYSGVCNADYPEVKQAIDDLRSVGIVTVAASGNNGWDDFISGPACISTAVAVGAVDDATGQVASYSNQSAQVDLLGPGTSIRSSFPPNVMGNLSGTSMATPAVAGAFAVLKEARPGATVDQLEADLKATGQLISLPPLGSWPYLKLTAPVTSALSGRPTVPLAIVGSPAVGEVAVSWSPPSSTGSSAVTGYTVTTSPGGATCSTVDLECTVTGLTNGKAYRFAVRAENASGAGAAASTPPVVPFTVPNAPLSVTGFGGSGKAILSWAAPAFDGGRSITGYTATASPGGSTCASTVALGCVVSGLTDGVPYTFTVRATNLGGAGSTSIASAPVVPAPGSMVPVTPARLMDTRAALQFTTVDGQEKGEGPIGGGAGATRSLPVLGRGNVPASGVAAVALNVTVTGPTADSWLRVFPSGAALPNASNLNYSPGQTVPNMVIAGVGSGGEISLRNEFGQADVIVDVLGWFPAGSGFTPLPTPARFMDTRQGAFTTVDGQAQGAGALGAGAVGTRTLRVTDRPGVPASGVGAVALNVTVTSPTAASWLRVHPLGSVLPNASSLNYASGQTVPNMVIARVGTDGNIVLRNEFGSVHVIVDVVGWFPSAAGFASLSPGRVLDTRPGFSTVDGSFSGVGAVGQGQTLALTVAGRGGVPPVGARAVALNVTVTGPTAASWLRVYRSGAAPPTSSNLNYLPGQTVPNMVVVEVGADGKILLRNELGATHVIVDVLGWFP